jgi:hypothetical protein
MLYGRKAILALLIVLLAGSATFAQDPGAGPASPGSGEPLSTQIAAILPALSPDEVNTLVTDGEITNLYSAPDSPRLAPMYADRIREDLRPIGPRIGVEVLFVVPADDAGIPETPEIYTTLQSISTMEGIEYYSQSRGYMRTLFHESYVIDDPDERNRIPDPVTTDVPPVDRLFVFQRDSSFGRNVLQLDYRVDGEAVFLTMTNLTRMYYQGIVPAVGPRGLIFHILVMPLGDHLLFYGHAGADAPSLFGIEDRIQMSFYNRIVALYTWYNHQIAKLTEF